MKREYSVIWRSSPAGLLSLIVLAGTLTLFSQPVRAESGTGIVISRNGEKVNVTYDPSALPYFDIYRKGDAKTVIRASNHADGEAFKLLVDPRLKKDSTVQETETPRGKVITINSEQVYMISQEDLGEVTLEKDKPAPSSGKKGVDPSKKAMQSAPKADGKSSVPTKSVPSEMPPSLNLTQKQVAVKTSADKQKGSAQESKLSNLSKLENVYKPLPVKTDLQVLPATSAAIRQLKPTNPPRPPEPGKALKAIKSVSPRPEGEAPLSMSGKPKSLTSSSGAAEKSKPEALSDSTFAGSKTDPESLPLDLSGREHQAAMQTSTGMMLRVTISLVVVLLLLIGFMKRILPRMMERYPGFFENLKRQNRFGDIPPDDDQESILGLPRMARPKARKTSPRPEVFHPEPVQPSAKKHYLERIGVGDERFNVITSTSLGKGKELHLVEIRGRQLVVATTPYTVSLIKDLSDQEPDSGPAGIEPAVSGLLTSNASDSAPPMGEDIETDDYYNPRLDKMRSYQSAYQPEEPSPAYLERNHAAHRETSAKPYASMPSDLPDLRSVPRVHEEPPPAEPEASDPLDQIYLKYLDPEEAVSELQRVRHQKREINRTIENFLEPGPYISTYNSHDVVLLEDYDDNYEG
ncbi:MAG TPA: flagellar biosynthetic protein FliO [Coleofasciculaceae cyanobacterium]